MPLYTGQYAIPYPTLQEAPNGPAQMQAMAEVIDTALSNNSFKAGLSTARPAHREGLAFYETDTGAIMLSDGSTWKEINRRVVAHAKINKTSSDQNISSGVGTTVTFQQNETSTIAGMADATNNRIVIKESGLYYVEFYGSFASGSSTGYRESRLTVDGSAVRAIRVFPSESIAVYIPISGLYRLTPNQTVGIDVAQDSGAARVVNTGCYLQAVKIAP